jgi:hypothetical protein
VPSNLLLPGDWFVHFPWATVLKAATEIFFSSNVIHVWRVDFHIIIKSGCSISTPSTLLHRSHHKMLDECLRPKQCCGIFGLYDLSPTGWSSLFPAGNRRLNNTVQNLCGRPVPPFIRWTSSAFDTTRKASSIWSSPLATQCRNLPLDNQFSEHIRSGSIYQWHPLSRGSLM